ncbi:MAG TPA: ABC transporter ATP-binding protein [Gemmatimonadota bacterium]|nr:ABC transporter ATP-binding protein [Gemmatimonadota bacterium]
MTAHGSAAGPAIRVEGLGRRFGPVVAVDGIHFDVARGELFGLVGPDGAGKTTTLRMLAGVLRPTSGDALVNGVSVARDPEGIRHAIAYMPQRFGLYGDLTVRENLDFYADLFGVPAAGRGERLERLYRFSGLGPFEDRLAGKLSGGMKQKLGLSCALVHEPEILLLDEPTFGVDPVSRRDLWLILHEMIATGVTILLSTSYLDEAERCDRVALLHEGRVIALDPPEALQRGLGLRLLVVDTQAPRQAREALRGRPEARRVSLFGNTVHLLLERDAGDAWVRPALETAGVPVGDVREETPSLEDVFLELTAGARVEAA